MNCMKRLKRWGKFCAVGGMGFVVQMGTLAMFSRWDGGHYLWASGAALEVTLLHNFAWHWCYTWRDRRESAAPVRQFLRFHLCNGLISMLGNLVVMRLLHEEGLPLLVSNLIAIAICSVANFCVGDRWAFAPATVARLAAG